MPSPNELPHSSEEDRSRPAQAGRISDIERARLLLYLARALLNEGTPTPFQDGVGGYLKHHSLDPEEVASFLEEVIDVFHMVHQDDGIPAHVQEDLTNALLEARGQVARRIECSNETTTDRRTGDEELVVGPRKARAKFASTAGTIPSSEALLRERQADKQREEERTRCDCDKRSQ